MKIIHTVLSYVVPLALGMALGLGALSIFGTTLYAQGGKLHADPALACAWDQPAASPQVAQTMHVQIVLDGGSPVAVQQTCTGTSSPYQCQFTATAAMLAVGPHTLIVQGANVDSIDGTLSAFANLVTVPYEIVPPLTPPLPGSNGRIIKIVVGIVFGLVTLFSLFGH
jgi:hypothetical protein